MDFRSDIILSIDPGTSKIGYAVVDLSGSTIEKGILKDIHNLNEIFTKIISTHNPGLIVLGDGTGSKKIGKFLESEIAASIPIQIINEKNSTEEARREYFLRYTPIRRFLLIVSYMLGISNPSFDDDVAVILAKRYLEEKSGD